MLWSGFSSASIGLVVFVVVLVAVVVVFVVVVVVVVFVVNFKHVTIRDPTAGAHSLFPAGPVVVLFSNN